MSQPSLSERVVEYVQASDAAIKKASANLDRVNAKQAAADALIPAAVAALIKGERIFPEEAKLAEAALRDPVEAIKLVIKVAGHRNVAERSLGDGTQKTAGTTASPIVGARTSTLRESDRRLFAGLDVPMPANG